MLRPTPSAHNKGLRGSGIPLSAAAPPKRLAAGPAGERRPRLIEIAPAAEAARLAALSGNLLKISLCAPRPGCHNRFPTVVP